MALRLGIWAQAVAPGARVRIQLSGDIHITNVTYGDVVDESERTVLKIYRQDLEDEDEDEDDEDEDDDEDDDKPVEFEKDGFVVARLLPGKVCRFLVALGNFTISP